MLLNMLVLLDSILQMQLFQINQSEESSKITIMSDITCVQLHQRPITSASNNNRITLYLVYLFLKYVFIINPTSFSAAGVVLRRGRGGAGAGPLAGTAPELHHQHP